MPNNLEQFPPPLHANQNSEVCCSCDRNHALGCSCGECTVRPSFACSLREHTPAICAYCCNCRTCARCNVGLPSGDDNDFNPNFCRRCNLCFTCSGCIRCPSCNSHTASVKVCCNRCGYCCDCGTIFVNNKMKFFEDDITQVLEKDKLRYLGAEIEVCNYYTSLDNVQEGRRIATKWANSIVHDGSLRGEATFEINSSPAKRAKFKEQISEWGNWFKEARAEVNDSCGLHVHIDTSDFSFTDMKKFCLLYHHLELALFSLVKKSRRNNDYCEPCSIRYVADLYGEQTSQEVEEHILMNIYGEDGQGRYAKVADKRNKDAAINRANRCKSSQKPSGRYKSVNLHGWMYRKAVEIRLGEGSVSPEYIINWTLMWEQIFNASYFLTLAQIKEVVASVTSTTEDDLSRLSMNTSHHLLHRPLLEQLGLLKLITTAETNQFIDSLFKKKFLRWLNEEDTKLYSLTLEGK